MTRSVLSSPIRIPVAILVGALLALLGAQLLSSCQQPGSSGVASSATIQLQATHSATTTTTTKVAMQVTGSRQGVFKGDKGGTGPIALLGYQFEAASSGSAGPGLGGARLQLRPVTVTHLLGPASAQFFAAEATSEPLTTVVIEVDQITPDGKEMVAYRITLSDATVMDVRQSMSGSDIVQDDSIAFRSVTQEDLLGKTTVKFP